LSGLTSYRRHRKILKAIEKRNLREARQQIREHIQTGMKAVLDQIRQREELMGLSAYGMKGRFTGS